ncbi:MAG: hypothetical protein UV73_C0006G0049 [Candidatus Gottesmanbacteria bacterium GW2011_GWA2_43_14]|uniref:Cohesin domain-containing protein n=1 Tax=Candidatus Gottesmanbacteria bacterium GW2011_GWA2_43_14 TaxID=1618443 RepID=A0A0G1DIN3_9BACT|nr:MAG: hypothetical protein UV73_C0006G0049 [Candidatus Gottesmanbacteria bacterium GW2011_GWA2_43_14]
MIKPAARKIKKIYRTLDNKSIGNPLAFILILLILPITVIAVQNTINYFSKAQLTGSVDAAFSPASFNLPPNANVKIMLDPHGQAVAFARVVIVFDKTKVKFDSEITTTASLSTVVEKTTMANANTSGKAVIVIAASPTDTQPASSFEFASFTLASVSSNNTDTSTLTFLASDMQIVSAGGTELTVNAASAAINNGGTNPTLPPTNTPPTLTPPTGNPQACNVVGSIDCYNQWKAEYQKSLTSKIADLNQDGKVDLIDFEIWRRAAKG